MMRFAASFQLFRLRRKLLRAAVRPQALLPLRSPRSRGWCLKNRTTSSPPWAPETRALPPRASGSESEVSPHQEGRAAQGTQDSKDSQVTEAAKAAGPT